VIAYDANSQASFTDDDFFNITSTGLVGINTASPTSPLTIKGDVRLLGYDSTSSSAVYFRDGGSGADDNAFHIGVVANDFAIVETGVGTRLTVETGGNVGIGEAASEGAESLLHVRGASAGANLDVIRIDNDAGNTSTEAGILFETGQLSMARISAMNEGSDLGALRFWTSGSSNTPSERMRITSGGHIQFNTTSNTQWTDSSGNGSLHYEQGSSGSRNTGIAISSDTSNGYAMFYVNAIDGADNERYFSFYRNDSQIGTITLNGTSNVSYDTSSDYRLKENIEPMTGSIARLKQIKPSTFNFISEPDRSCEGFIAHELGEVVPNAVSGKKDAMRDDGKEIMPQGVDFGRVVPLLVSALQEAIERIEVLENA